MKRLRFRMRFDLHYGRGEPAVVVDALRRLKKACRELGHSAPALDTSGIRELTELMESFVMLTRRARASAHNRKDQDEQPG